ncbi:MAG: hypothetical protein JWM57_4390, partial [Phycisphaerales bacterium]|nr:hypothetical protein [Phycisphaerales bacterium]
TVRSSSVYGSRQDDVVTYENGQMIHSSPVTIGTSATLGPH